ncbi:MAG: hypothetical protein ACREAY_05580 [Nitrososphaera sp.]|uniref:hypothetical protein n=1 Tax=Nitrososphaera sp. TaxID=1971748 RepID=UPI003D7020E7
MRIPLKGSDHFSKQVNSAFEKILEAYTESIKPSTEMRKANAMLGDGTVTQVDTFDPQNVQNFYQRLTNGMEGWLANGISNSKTEDLHRLFCQFNKDVGKYHVSGYFGVQYHALPYYKADKRVIEIQKELAGMVDNAAMMFQDMTGKADKALQKELEKRGFAELGFEDLFTKMFDDEKLAEALDKKATSVENEFSEFQQMGKKKSALFAELNDLMIELYQTSHAYIDHNRLMQGEEGFCTYFDVELIKNRKTNKREAVFETPKIPKEEGEGVAAELLAVAKTVKKSK